MKRTSMRMISFLLLLAMVLSLLPAGVLALSAQYGSKVAISSVSASSEIAES